MKYGARLEEHFILGHKAAPKRDARGSQGHGAWGRPSGPALPPAPAIVSPSLGAPGEPRYPTVLFQVSCFGNTLTLAIGKHSAEQTRCYLSCRFSRVSINTGLQYRAALRTSKAPAEMKSKPRGDRASTLFWPRAQGRPWTLPRNKKGAGQEEGRHGQEIINATAKPRMH